MEDIDENSKSKKESNSMKLSGNTILGMGKRKALLNKHSSNAKMVEVDNRDDLYFGKYIAPEDSEELSVSLNESYVQRAYRREQLSD